MSILLTASAKKKFLKKLKDKQSSSDSAATGSTTAPPGSNDLTAVWYWLLNGVETTVMCNRESSEIWCNGCTINAEARLDPSHGYVYDFVINLPEVQSCHQANLLRMSDGGRYVLYVDGYVINEYYN